jgi:hypothetical protein
MPIAENSIRYRAVIDKNQCYRTVLKKRDIWNKLYEKTGQMRTLDTYQIKYNPYEASRYVTVSAVRKATHRQILFSYMQDTSALNLKHNCGYCNVSWFSEAACYILCSEAYTMQAYKIAKWDIRLHTLLGGKVTSLACSYSSETWGLCIPWVIALPMHSCNNFGSNWHENCRP